MGQRLEDVEKGLLDHLFRLLEVPRVAKGHAVDIVLVARKQRVKEVGLPGRVDSWIAKAKELTAEAE